MNLQAFLQRYGKWAIITGASSGIGKCFAIELAKRGLNLVLVARRQPLLDSLASQLSDEYNVAVKVISLDLGSQNSTAEVVRRCGELDIGLLVSNAGFGFKGRFSEQPLPELQNMIQTNCVAGAELAHAFIPRMIRRGTGGIIFTGSVEGEMAFPNSASYAATKAFVHSLGTALWDELKSTGIDVLVLSPGSTDTEAPLKQGISRDQLAGLMSPEAVAQQALEQIDNGPLFIPGKMNRFIFPLLSRLPKRWIAPMMGKGMSRAIEKSKN